MIPVPLERLEALAALAPAQEPATVPGRPFSGVRFELPAWIAQHQLDVIGPHPWQGGQKWIFRICPFNPDHRNRSAYLLQFASGAVQFGCHHNSCTGNGWHALRDLVEPGWNDRRAPSPTQFPIPGPIGDRQIGNAKTNPQTALAAVVKVWERAEPEPRPSLVSGLIAALSTTIVYADGGIGKSYLVMLLLVLALLGRPFAGKYVQNIKSALFIDAELDADEFTRRAYSLARGLGLEAPPEGLHYWRLPGPLSNHQVHDAVRMVIAGCQAEVVALDSLTIASYGTDASEQADMTAILKEIEQWPSTKILIDHPPAPKPGVNTSAYRPFGSTFKFNLARSVLQLVRADGGALTLRQTKNNFGPLAEPIHLAMAFADGKVTIESITADDDRLSGVEDHLPAMERVARALAQAGHVGTTPEELGKDLDMAPKTVRNHLTSLKSLGRVVSTQGKWLSRFPAPIGTGNGNDAEEGTIE